jgi:hypothetical protein
MRTRIFNRFPSDRPKYRLIHHNTFDAKKKRPDGRPIGDEPPRGRFAAFFRMDPDGSFDADGARCRPYRQRIASICGPVPALLATTA